MKRRVFAEAYAGEVRPSPYLSDLPRSTQHIIEPYESWSHTLGDLLYSVINTDSQADLNQSTVNDTLLNYGRFVTSHDAGTAAAEIIQSIDKDSNRPEPVKMKLGTRALQAHNFHIMSQVMLPQWVAMIGGKCPSETLRKKQLSLSQLSLASAAISHALLRAEETSILSDYSFFTEENKDKNSYITGTLSEIDAGIALTDLSRTNPHLTFIPAPKRFEDNHAAVNVDFIGYNALADEITGIQVKTRISEAARSRYDTSRVALIDSVEHMGGTIWTRTEAGKAATKRVPWPGMVSLDYLNSIKLHGEKNMGYEHFDQRQLLSLRRHASQLLSPRYDTRKKIKGNLQTARKNILDTIMPYLEQDIY